MDHEAKLMLIALIAALSVIWAIAYLLRVGASWKTVAEQLNLQRQSGVLGFGAALTGELGKTPIRIGMRRVHNKSWAHSKMGESCTEFHAKLSEPWFSGVQIERRELDDVVEELFGTQDFELGEQGLQKHFDVRGEMTDRVQSLLARQDVQTALHRLRQSFDELEINSGGITVFVRGRASNHDTMIRRIKELVDVTSQIDAAASDQSVQPHQ